MNDAEEIVAKFHFLLSPLLLLSSYSNAAFVSGEGYKFEWVRLRGEMGVSKGLNRYNSGVTCDV